MSKNLRVYIKNKIMFGQRQILASHKQAYSQAKPITSKTTKKPKIFAVPKQRLIRKKEPNLTENTFDENDIARLISVEREYVREIVNSPIKYNSKSSLPQKKSSLSPNKKCICINSIDKMKVSDFLQSTTKNKLNLFRQTKFSITPDPLMKRK
jgi:hypothetical protein